VLCTNEEGQRLSLATLWEYTDKIYLNASGAWEQFKNLTQDEKDSHNIFEISFGDKEVIEILTRISETGIFPKNITGDVVGILEDED
jgi:hypothetical protein